MAQAELAPGVPWRTYRDPFGGEAVEVETEALVAGGGEPPIFSLNKSIYLDTLL